MKHPDDRSRRCFLKASLPVLSWPDAQARRAKLRSIGYGIRSDFELNFGPYLPSFGRADGDDTGQKR
jgi:hypothetical protein